MANKSHQSTDKANSGKLGTKLLSPNQGSPAIANVASNQTKQSNAKDSRSGGKRNA